MANYGSGTTTPYHGVGSALYLEKNEIIAFKPQITTNSVNDWWFGLSSPDIGLGASPGESHRGMLFYSRHVTSVDYGRLCWVDELQTTKSQPAAGLQSTGFAWAVAGNRNANITGLFEFNPLIPTIIPPSGTAAVPAVPFLVHSAKSGLVTNLNADRVDGYHAIPHTCATIASAAHTIPVYRDKTAADLATTGQLVVGDPIDPCDAINLRFFQANQIGVNAMKPVQWATTFALVVNVSDAGKTLTSTTPAIFAPDPDTRPTAPPVTASTTETSAHRVLVKDQWVSGANTPAIQNGIYYVHTLGSGSQQYVLKRASDADTDGELAKGNLVFVEWGGQNSGSQFQLNDKSPSDGTIYGPAINPGVEPNWWQLFFRVSSYLQGNGIVIDGQTIHFAQKEQYPNQSHSLTPMRGPLGSVFAVNTPTSLVPIIPVVGTPRFLKYSGIDTSMPAWGRVDWETDIDNRPGTYDPSPHTHPPSAIQAPVGIARAIGYFSGVAPYPLSGDTEFTYNDSQRYIYIGATSGALPRTGPTLFYPSAAVDTTNTDLLSLNTSTGQVSRRTIASFTSGFWGAQSGTVRRHVRWTGAADSVEGTVSTSLQDGMLVDDIALNTVKPAEGTTVNLGTDDTEFASLFVGVGNLGKLNGQFVAGGTLHQLLGIESEATSTRREVKAFSSLSPSVISLATGAVGYGSSAGKLTGDVSKLFFDESGGADSLRVKAGTIALPTLAFIAEPTLGIFRNTTAQLSVSAGGARALTVAATVTTVARDFYSEATTKTASLGLTGSQWGSFFLYELASTGVVSSLSGWATANTGKVESFSASKVKDFLGLTSLPSVGVGTKDFFAMWVDTKLLGNAPFKVENTRSLNQSLRHLAPGTSAVLGNPLTGFDLGGEGGTTTYGSNGLGTGNNTNFDSGLGNWAAKGPFVTVTAASGRMVVAFTNLGVITHGTELATGVLSVTAGKRYQIDFTVKVDSAMPPSPTQWVVTDTSTVLTFESGQFFSPTTSDQTFTAIATAGGSGTVTVPLGFSENVSQSALYTVSFDNVIVREIITSAGAELRWRKLLVRDIDVLNTFMPTTDLGVVIGHASKRFFSIHTSAPLATVAPAFLSGWQTDPSVSSGLIQRIPKSLVLGFLGFDIGTLDVMTKWSATGLVNSAVKQTGLAVGSSDMSPSSDKGVDLGKDLFRWRSFTTDAASSTTLMWVSGWEDDPSAAAESQVLKRYNAATVKGWLNLTNAVVVGGGSSADRMTKWVSINAELGDSQITQPTNVLRSIDELVSLGASTFRWASFWTKAAVGTTPSVMAGWGVDPNGAGGGGALSSYTSAQVRSWIGLGSGGTGTAYRLTKWNNAGGGPVDSLVTEVEGTTERGLQIDEHAYIDGLIEPFSHAAWVTLPRPQIRAGYYSNQLANFDVGNPMVVTSPTPALVVHSTTGSAAVTGTTGLWRAVYLPSGGGTGGTYSTGFRSVAPVWSGSGNVVFEFTASQLVYSSTTTWTPFVMVRRGLDANLITAIRVDYRDSVGTWTLSETQTPPRWSPANNSVWIGSDFTPPGASGIILTGVRFTLTIASAVDLRIMEVGLWNIYATPGAGVTGLLHTPNRWQQPNLYLSYAANQSGAGTEACGSASAPMVAIRQANTGLFSGTAGQIHFTCNGTWIAAMGSSGLSIGTSVISALLGFGAGSAAVPPIRFAATSNVLTSALVAGTFESDNARLYFTNTINSVVSRHGMAMLDDLNQFNDPNAENAGAVNFNTNATGFNMAVANINSQVIGTGDITVACRARFPAVSAAAQHLWAITSATSGGGGGSYDWLAYNSTTGLYFVIRDSGGVLANGRQFLIPAATMAQFAGRIIDLMVVRASGVITIWINGLNLTPTPTGGAVEAQPICNSQPMFFHVGNMHTGTVGWLERVYSARIFNRALSYAEIVDLIRHGVDELDKWGLTRDLIVDGGFADASKWTITPAGGTAVAAGVLTYNNTSGASQAAYQIVPFSTSADIIAAGGYLGKRFRAQGVVTGTPTQIIRFGFGASGTSSPPLVQGVNTFESLWTVANASIYAGVITTAATGATLDSFTLAKIGCFIDLDFGKVFGKTVWDWSGRFHATLNGTYEIVRGDDSSMTYPEGVDGTVTVNLRKYTRRVSVMDGTKVSITHNLGVQASYSVSAWDLVFNTANPPVLQTAHSVTVGFVRTGDNTMDVLFDSIGAPVTPKLIEIVIIA